MCEVMKPAAVDKNKREKDKANQPNDHVEKAQQSIASLTSETSSARRFAAALGNFGIQESTLTRLSQFAQDGEAAFAKLLGVVHADAADQASDPSQVDDILKDINSERSWFLSVRASYEQMLRSKKKLKRKAGEEIEQMQQQQQQSQGPEAQKTALFNGQSTKIDSSFFPPTPRNLEEPGPIVPVCKSKKREAAR